ncbi:hypothetical protein [Pedobacter agri]|uniref:hypothetical protein n=1 Tax=Pedobacter agri TaxID=454586 RepID=UPI00292D3DAD|nr:hypothetical protein [Pedobacter agri]
MDSKIAYSGNDRKFVSKPEGWLSGSLKYEPIETDINQLIVHLIQGKSICAGIYKDNVRCTANFIKQQIVGVDFDGTMTLEEVNAIMKDYNIMYNFGYYTFKHTPASPRFRLFYVLDGEIWDAKLAKDVSRAFNEIFDRKPDISAIDAARVWLGTNQGYFEGSLHDTTSVVSILQYANYKIFDRDRCQTRSLLPIKKVEKEECANMINPIKYYYKQSQNCTQLVEEEYEIDSIQNWKIEELLEITLFKMFYDGLGTETKGNKLVHHELLGLASNLIQLKGGMKLFKECIKRNRFYSKDKYSIINYLKQNPYPPMRLNDFSPFEEDQLHQFQTFPDLIRKKGKVKIIDKRAQPTYITEKKASEELKNAFEYVLNADNNKVYLLEVATGLGKTERIKNTGGIVIAFPDNALKNEQFNSSKLKPKQKLLTPSTVGLFSKSIDNRIQHLFSIGKNDQVIKLINEIAELSIDSISTTKITNEDRVKAREYINQISEVGSNESVEKTIFTTHTRALFTQYPHDTLIFDENPLGSLLEIKAVLIQDLQTLSQSEESIPVIDHLINNSTDNECYHTPDFSDLRKRIDNLGVTLDISSNVFKFFESDYYIKDKDHIHYLLNHVKRLPKNKKIIIADATPPLVLWKHLLSDRLEVISIKNVKFKGSIQQYTNISCSRISLDKHQEEIASKVGSDVCITFKDRKKYFENPCNSMHFGRVRGSNELAGKPFSVVGTPHHSNYLYRFIAKICGITTDKFVMRNERVQYKNKEFLFRTFENESLRNIHLELVEGEIIQAVDRARLIRNNVEVKLYSNLPIDQATYTTS